MKTFLGVFFGILSAVAVLWLIVYLKQRYDQQAKLENMKRSTLDLSAACKAFHPGTTEMKLLEDELEKAENSINDLDLEYNSEGWSMREAAFHNQVLANGCFQAQTPKSSNSHGRKIKKK